MHRRLTLLALAFAAAPAHGQQVSRIAQPPAGIIRLPDHVVGRVQAVASGSLLRQWPGTYFTTGFIGQSAYFRVGPGKVSLRVTLDDAPAIPLVAPAVGFYLISGLRAGTHRLRIDVASESQSGQTGFGGFFATAGTMPAPPRPAARPRAIEFIGDSHTVGYGNTSATRDCTDEQVWATTDTSRGIAPRMAGRYGADYVVNAISGRGVVRNYAGFAADTLPRAYPFTLFGGKQAADAAGWHPQLIVIGLGTNDFSTPLHAGERWPDRAALHADYEANYVRFVADLRARHPQAHVILWATDLGGEEILTEVSKVTDRLRRAGEQRIGFVPVRGLAFSGCNAHPDLADDQMIADALADYIDGQPGIWNAGPRYRPSRRRD